MCQLNILFNIWRIFFFYLCHLLYSFSSALLQETDSKKWSINTPYSGGGWISSMLDVKSFTPEQLSVYVCVCKCVC